MMIKCLKYLLAIGFLAFSNNAFTQNYDTKLRLSAGIDGDINKQLKAGLEYEHRFDRNISAFDKAFIEPEIEYEVIDDVNIGAKYRLGIDQKSLGKRYAHRYSFFANYNYDLDDFEITAQGVMQYGFDDIDNAINPVENALVARYSISVDYDWFGTKIEPYAKYELYHHLNHPNGNILNEWKLKLGIKYDLTRKSGLNIFYMFENEFNVAKPDKANILGIGYSYSL